MARKNDSSAAAVLSAEAGDVEEREEGEEKRKDTAIPPPNLTVAAFEITGTTLYVQNKFSGKAAAEMKEKQEAGSQAKKGKKREAKDFQAAYKGAQHRMQGGGWGIPAPAFRNGMISACKLVGFKMTQGKLTIFIEADGIDAEDGTPLVKITNGEPTYFEQPVRLVTGVVDLRARPAWRPGWKAVVRVRFDADFFSVNDVTNLLMRVGSQVGIGEGRPDSKKSCGMGWGLFDVDTSNVMVEETKIVD